MTPDQLRTWMESLGLNKVRASSELGITRMTLDKYLREGKIPRYIELACEALSLRWQKIKPSPVPKD